MPKTKKYSQGGSVLKEDTERGTRKTTTAAQNDDEIMRRNKDAGVSRDALEHFRGTHKMLVKQAENAPRTRYKRGGAVKAKRR